ncbi:MAG TPA: energy transducer TonB [Burkholderiaceae bacterium]|nr:energy transducer TonB [Burkholderiaceae bacterium]
MNFSQRQADPRRHLVGLTVVIVFHALLVYALVTGLAKKVVDVVRAPIETKVIEEIKKPPPPPEVVLPPPPKLEAPPPPYIPPPEVQIATPPPPAPTISVAPSPTPPPPTVMTPTPPPVVAAPPAPPKPAVMSIGVACSTQVPPVMPPKAVREGITGSVRARATIKGGKVVAVEILSSQPRGIFDNAVRNAMMQYGCQAGEEEIKAEQTFDFKLE